MRRFLPLILLAAAACSPKPTGDVSSAATPAMTAAPASSSGFCRVLNEYLAAADGDFASLRTGEPEKLMHSWAARVSLPGATACRVADKDPTSFGSVFCVLSESADAASLESDYAAAIGGTKACLGWKMETGEQLRTRWAEFVPPEQKSATRSLRVHVRYTAPVERAKGTVTLDVSAKKPGVEPAN